MDNKTEEKDEEFLIEEPEVKAEEENESVAETDIPVIVISDTDAGSPKKKINIKRLFSSLEFYFVMLFLYLELLFHLVRFGFKADYLSYKLLFGVFYGIALGTVVSSLPKLVSKILTFLFTIILVVYLHI